MPPVARRTRTVKATDLTLAEAAARAGVKPKTWSAYVARGQAPAPTTRLGRTPIWDRDDIDTWLANRPRARPTNP